MSGQLNTIKSNMVISMDLDSKSNLHQAAVQVPKFNNSRQDPNPILAAHMLQEMYKMLIEWQQELEQIDRDCLNITASGPILAAWLESRTFKPGSTGAAIPSPYLTVDAIGLTTVDPQAGYRLCGLDEHGELWVRACAMSEILSVSQAIARYQQLKDLNTRKQKIESYIRQILEDLVHLRIKLEEVDQG
jgi:hypothetical protein